MRPVLANLGFVLQIAGMLMVLPILLGFYYNETQPLISFFITALVFFGSGFLFNVFSERTELNFKSSCILITVVFFLLGLIGSIPYLYNNVFHDSVTSQFTDSFFESISGYTTTGLTFITNIDSLPKSLIFYHGLTQWIGGIGIVFILLAFFYPSGSIIELVRVLGFEKIKEGIKRVLTHVLFIYTVYVLVFISILYFLGLKDVLISVSLLFSTIATGGFSPVTNFSELLVNNRIWVLSLVMIIGAMNFFIHDKLIRGKVRKIFTKELIMFILVILFSWLLVSAISGLGFISSLFHVISASTTTGFNFISFSGLNESTKLIFVLLMLIGGMSLSTAGGVKILRLLLFFKSVPWIIKKLLLDKREPLILGDTTFHDKDVFVHLLIPLIAISILFVSAFVFSLNGFSFSDSLFETTSAFSTTGLSVGLTTASLPVALKWWLTLLMVIGRVEIIPFLVFFSPPIKESEQKT